MKAPAKEIPLQLAGKPRVPDIEIDGALVAAGLGLEPEAFRRLLEERKVAVLCERGVGEDAGLYRATYWYRERRFRAVLAADGRIVHAGP